MARYRPVLLAAGRGDRADWADAPRSRLALIIVLGQFLAHVHRGTPAAFAQDAKALDLSIGGFAIGHFERLATVWEKTFLFRPLSYSEQIEMHEALVDEAPPHLRRLCELSAWQAAGTAT